MVNSKKLNKKQLREKQVIEDKKFTKTLIIRFGFLMLLLGLILVFVTYRCDTKYNYRKSALYGIEIPAKLICMNGNKLAYHQTIAFMLKDNIFYVCSEGCKMTITNRYDDLAFIIDAFSGDTICKAKAIIGLKVRRKPDVVYLKTYRTLKIIIKQRKGNKIK